MTNLFLPLTKALLHFLKNICLSGFFYILVFGDSVSHSEAQIVHGLSAILLPRPLERSDYKPAYRGLLACVQ